MTKIKISENKLREIVKDSVSRVINHDLISPINEESEFLNNPPFIIEEGLIKTYPIDKSINAFAEVYKLQVVSSRKEAYTAINKAMNEQDANFNGVIGKEGSLNDTERILMILGDTEYNKEIASHYMDKYGYILSSEQPYMSGWKIYVFEKKFDNDAADIVKSVGELYHICKMSLRGKIFKQGLTPRSSQWKTFNNGPRCYFFLPITYEQIEQWVMDFRFKKKQLADKYMLLKIDVNKLPEGIKFYADPRMKNAVYSLQGIPPMAIEVVEENINGKMM